MMQDEIRDINEAIHRVNSRYSPIPAGDLRDAFYEVLVTTVRQHRHVPETPEQVAMCECGDEWACREVTAMRQLARVITRMAEDAATTYLPRRGV